MEFRSELLIQSPAEGLFDETAGVPTFAAGKASGCDRRLTVWGDSDFDGLQATPPIWTVSLTAPLSSRCSVTLWPLRRASIFAFSTA